MSSRKQEKQQLREERLRREREAEAAARRQRLVRLGFAVALAAVLVVAAIVLSQSGAEDSYDFESAGKEVSTMLEGVPQRGFEAGDADAPVTLTEFGDLQCPFCAQFAKRTLPNLIERYVRPGDVLYVLEPISFIGEDSREAAEAAAAAALQDRGVAFAEVLYLNQQTENSGYVDEGFLRSVAEATPGLDADSALDDAGSPRAEELLAKSEGLAQNLGIESTPSFFIAAEGEDPQPLVAQPTDAEAFASEIERLLPE